MPNLNVWRLKFFGTMALLWAAILAAYKGIFLLGGGVPATLERVSGGGNLWSVLGFSLLVTAAGLLGWWLAAHNHKHPIVLGVVVAAIFVAALAWGIGWVDWNVWWLLAPVLAAPLLIGAGATLLLAEHWQPKAPAAPTPAPRRAVVQPPAPPAPTPGRGVTRSTP